MTGTQTFLSTSPPIYTILMSAPYVLFMLSSEMSILFINPAYQEREANGNNAEDERE